MARPLRIQFEGAVYHVTSRGNARQEIFLDDKDRNSFLETLGRVVDRFGWICHAYCLMNNHYHLLIETPAANLSRGMQMLNGIYPQSFNRRHGRVGHVLQGRFKAIVGRRRTISSISRGMSYSTRFGQWLYAIHGSIGGPAIAPRPEKPNRRGTSPWSGSCRGLMRIRIVRVWRIAGS